MTDTPDKIIVRTYDISFLISLVHWYKSGAAENTPIRVRNALDSLSELIGANDYEQK